MILQLVALSLAVSCGRAAPSPSPSRPVVVADSHPISVVSSQSHAQDELGQYTYSYSNPLSTKVESKTVDGITRGGYTYLDSHGLVQNVNYVSDDVNGFRVAASNLPLGRLTPQEDEPLVAHEKAKAIAALHEAAVKDAVEATIVHENDVVGPVAHVVHAAPSHDPSPAAALYSHPVTDTPVPVVHVTPVPYHAPSPTPVAEVSHDYHPAPTHGVPAEHPHSYAIVELDSSDIPAPHQAPGAYFRPAASAVHPEEAPKVAPAEYHAPVAVPSPVPVLSTDPHQVVDPAPHSLEHAVVSPAPHSLEHPVVAPAVHSAPIPVPTVSEAPIAPPLHSAPIVVAPLPAAHETPAPVVHSAPAPAAAVVAAPVAVVSSQSHAQDELGQYTYSYSNPLSSKVESKTVDGVTRGGYAYLDSHGLVQNVNYVSDDHHGFRVAASNLPSPAVPVHIPDSHDVAAAKAVFFAEIAKAKAAVGEH